MAGAILAGWLADRLLGDPARRHPVAGFGALAGLAERLLWRPSRAWGALYVGALVGATAGLTAGADRALRGHPVLRAIVVWITLGGRSLERAALALAESVRDDDLEAARALAPTLVGRDPAGLDGPELCRAALESVAENTSDAVVAPLLWAALLGTPGATAYRAINTLDAMVGHRSERHLRFGWAAARADDLANWPAARLTASLAILLGGRPAAAWRAAFRDGRTHPSPNAGRVEGAFAGALGVRLGGVNRYSGRVERRPALGDGRPPTPDDVIRGAALARVVGVAATGACTGLAWSLGR